jgi:hypothetical protein
MAKEKDIGKSKDFTSLDGKIFTRSVDKRGVVQYRVKDPKARTTKLISAKEFVKEGSRFRAQKRIQDLKDAAAQKKRDEEEKKAAIILAAERKRQEEEFKKKQAESVRIANEKKRIKKDQETLEQAKELSRFLNAISDENDMVAKMTNQLLDHYDESLRVSYWRGISKSFLRLSENFTALDRKLSDLYEKVRKAKIVTEQNIKDFDGLVAGSDPLFKKFEGLLTDADNRKSVALNKQSERDAKNRRKKKRSERIDLVRKGRASQKEAEIENKRKAKEAEDYKARRAKIVAKRMERNLQRPEREARREGERGKALEDNVLNDLLEEKKRRLDKKASLDKFLRPELDKMHGSIRVPTKALIGGSKLIGGLAMAPINALGFDFSDEGQLLSTLFSPFGAAGKAGLGVLRSGIEKFAGTDEKSIESLDDFSNVSLKGKRKTTDIQKALKKLPKEKKAEIQNKYGNIFNTTNNSHSNSSAKNFSNSSVRNNSSVSSSGGISSTMSSMFGSSPKSFDFNRTDDKDGSKLDIERNELLKDILKVLKGKSSSGANNSGFGMGGRGMGLLGKLGKVAIPGAIALQTGVVAGDMLNSMMETNQNVNNVTKGSLTQIENNLRAKNASEGDIRAARMLTHEIIEAKKSGDTSKATRLNQERAKIMRKYSSKTNKVSNTNSSDMAIDSSTVSNFRNVGGDSTIIKSKINTIEKMSEIKDDPNKRSEELKRFLLGEFITKLVDVWVGKISQNKGMGGTMMPPLQPF